MLRLSRLSPTFPDFLSSFVGLKYLKSSVPKLRKIEAFSRMCTISTIRKFGGSVLFADEQKKTVHDRGSE